MAKYGDFKGMIEDAIYFDTTLSFNVDDGGPFSLVLCFVPGLLGIECQTTELATAIKFPLTEDNFGVDLDSTEVKITIRAKGNKFSNSVCWGVI